MQFHLKSFGVIQENVAEKLKNTLYLILHLQEGLTCVRVEKGGVRAGGEKVVGQTCGP